MSTGISKALISKGASGITMRDMGNVLDRLKDLGKIMAEAASLSNLRESLETILSLVQDYWTGDYREIPYRTIAAIVFTLAYILSPADMVPDWIPVVGFVDDAAVVQLCLDMFEADLKKYRFWKKRARSIAA